MKFVVPEVFFKESKERVHNDLPVPSPLTKLGVLWLVYLKLPLYTGGGSKEEMVLLVGAAGSGKSTFARDLIR